MKKYLRHLLFGILIIGGSISASTVVIAQSSKNSSDSSSNTNLACAYALYGILFYNTGSCPSKGTPTIVSQANVTIPDESLRELLDYDKTLYRETVYAGLQCGPCWKNDILKSCLYDSNGDFVGGIPLRKPFSDNDKAVLLDINSSYSFTICPFKGKPTPTENPTPPNTIVIGGESFNVTDLGKNTITNVAKSISNKTSIQKTSQALQKVELTPLKQIKSGIKIRDIKCKEEFVLVIKKSNDQPSCVRPISEQRLLAHGWVTPDNIGTVSQLDHTNIKNPTMHENPTKLGHNNIKSTIAHENTTTPMDNNSTKHLTESVPVRHQNENTTVSNNNRYPTNYYPVNQTTIVRTINASELPPIGNISLIPAVSTTPLPPIKEPTIIHYSNQNIVKITAVGMSPNPLKVDDIPIFTVTYQNISGKPIYGIQGCSGGPDLQYVVTPPSKVEHFYYSSCQHADFGDIIQPNQIITEMPDSVYVYKIIQPGVLNVMLSLDLSDNSTYYSHNIDTIQFNVTATQ